MLLPAADAQPFVCAAAYQFAGIETGDLPEKAVVNWSTIRTVAWILSLAAATIAAGTTFGQQAEPRGFLRAL